MRILPIPGKSPKQGKLGSNQSFKKEKKVLLDKKETKLLQENGLLVTAFVGVASVNRLAVIIKIVYKGKKEIVERRRKKEAAAGNEEERKKQQRQQERKTTGKNKDRAGKKKEIAKKEEVSAGK